MADKTVTILGSHKKPLTKKFHFSPISNIQNAQSKIMRSTGTEVLRRLTYQQNIIQISQFFHKNKNALRGCNSPKTQKKTKYKTKLNAV